MRPLPVSPLFRHFWACFRLNAVTLVNICHSRHPLRPVLAQSRRERRQKHRRGAAAADRGKPAVADLIGLIRGTALARMPTTTPMPMPIPMDSIQTQTPKSKLQTQTSRQRQRQRPLDLESRTRKMKVESRKRKRKALISYLISSHGSWPHASWPWGWRLFSLLVFSTPILPHIPRPHSTFHLHSYTFTFPSREEGGTIALAPSPVALWV